MENKTAYVSRVNQLDAYLLDKEIVKIIQEQLSHAYKELPPGILSKFQPEIDALLKTLIWLNSILFNKSTFGQQILAITYQSDKLTRNKLILHYLLTILAPYTREFGHLRLTSNVHLQKIISWIEFCAKLLTIINFFRFLKTGQYPSLVDYFVRWKHISQSGAQMRNFGYAYMNRELIWTGFLELLNVTLPLVNYNVIQRKITQFLTSSQKNCQIVSKISPIMTIDTKCAICSKRPSIPHHINCQHVFCYFCIQGNLMMDSEFSCPICDTKNNGNIYPLEMKME
ncbi:hypothetical protein PVAND_008123 [Polypedilum vanderplanki]|uniref:RING-type E3 ubiquitin transferase (cysteine targeting) n=1 Tax=Polypedilum vanderplanki TaxID=319348 RepID=A0A9J6C9L0_POLVA|nr:hypothetical protein PVAND_008123 [Polypedilum vanderplanki]